jgi:hypothetical protein
MALDGSHLQRHQEPGKGGIVPGLLLEQLIARSRCTE